MLCRSQDSNPRPTTQHLHILGKICSANMQTFFKSHTSVIFLFLNNAHPQCVYIYVCFVAKAESQIQSKINIAKTTKLVSMCTRRQNSYDFVLLQKLVYLFAQMHVYFQLPLQRERESQRFRGWYFQLPLKIEPFLQRRLEFTIQSHLQRYDTHKLLLK